MAETYKELINYDDLLVYDMQSKLKMASKAELPKNTSDLYNDSNFQTSSDVTSKINDSLESSGFQKAQDVTNAIETAAQSGDWQSAAQVQTAINNAVKDFVGIDFQVVEVLPGEGKKGTIYLVANAGGVDYSEYVWIETDSGGKFEQLGSVQAPDLSGYLKTEDVTICAPSKITAMFAEE